MQHRYFITITVVLAFILMLGGIFLSKSHPQIKPPLARVSQKVVDSTITLEVYQPPVFIKLPQQAEVEAKGAEALTPGTLIRTGETGRAQLIFPKGTVARLDTSTQITLVTFAPSAYQIKIHIASGQVWSRIIKLSPGSSYMTESAHTSARVKGTAYGHVVGTDGKDQIITAKGEVAVACLNDTETGAVSQETQAIFGCKTKNKKGATALTAKDKAQEWYAFNQAEDHKVEQRFGKDSYGDIAAVLGASTPRTSAKKNDSGAANKSLANASSASGENTSHSISIADTQPTPTVKPSVTVTPTTKPTTTPTPNLLATPTGQLLPPAAPHTSQPTATPAPTGIPTATPRPAYAMLEVYDAANPVVVQRPGHADATAMSGDKVQNLAAGTVVTTGAGSRAQVLYPNGSATRIDENTRITISTLDDSNIDVNIEYGDVWSRVKKLVGEETYETHTDTQIATVRGTSYGHFVNSDGDGHIIAIEGIVTGMCKKNKRQALIRKRFKGFLRCKLDQDPDVLGMSDQEINIDWILFNILEDRRLSRRNPTVVYYDPNEGPIDMPGATDAPSPTLEPSPRPTSTPAPIARLEVDTDIQNVIMSVENVADFAAFDYQLLYDSDSGQQAVQGEKQINKNAYTHTFTLGTCSSGVCTYDQHVKNIKLTISLRNDHGDIGQTLIATALAANPDLIPTVMPTSMPSPTATPTLIPTQAPTATPTLTPSPTYTPSPSPTLTPTVTPSPTPTNAAPVVNAGPDQTVRLPDDAVLSPSGSDDGLPTGSSLTLGWSQVSGPATAIFTGKAKTPTVSFSTAGSYVLRFFVSDGDLTSSDDVVITVLPPLPVITLVTRSQTSKCTAGTCNVALTIDGNYFDTTIKAEARWSVAGVPYVKQTTSPVVVTSAKKLMVIFQSSPRPLPQNATVTLRVYFPDGRDTTATFDTIGL